MRHVAHVLTALTLTFALVACGGSSTSDPDADATPDTSDGEVTPDGTSDADVPDEDTPDSDADVPTCNDPATDCGSLTLGDCEEAACVEGACAAVAIPNCCVDAGDCDDTGLGACEELACEDSVCVVNDKVLGNGDVCCEDVADCTAANGVDARFCDVVTCEANVCAVAEDAKPNCCDLPEDCADLGDGCCSVGVCGSNNKCKADTLENCCMVSEDCDDGNPNTEDACIDSCVALGCGINDPVCEVNKVFTVKNFDDGTLQAMKVIDGKVSDKVTVTPRQGQSVSPGWSAYFGDPSCETYYNGPLTAGCKPVDPFANGSTAISVDLESAEIVLDADAGAMVGFWVRMAAEPALEADLGSGPQLFDTDVLKLFANDGSGAEMVWKSTAASAFGQENSTNGQWRFQVAKLSKFAGKSVKLRFSFTADAAGNFNTAAGGAPWYGAYIDSVTVRATCANETCTEDGPPCPADGKGCTADVCTPYAVGAGAVCGYQTAKPGESCQNCNQAGDCGADSCFDYTCDAGVCGSDLKEECCLPSSSFPEATNAPEIAVEGFEDGDISDWDIVDPFPADNVGWQVQELLPFAGSWALYFGDPITQSYKSSAGNPAQATAWTPSFQVEDDPFRTPIASMWLWLSTENDGAVTPQDKFDKLTIMLEPDGGAAVKVWDSFESVAGSTDFKYQQIGIDLSTWKGQSVRLGFKFDSVDNQNDQGNGARIDDLTVTSQCAPEGSCITFSDCDDDDVCTADWCDFGTCNNEKDDPLCCAVNADCDDSNACTTESCVDGTCESAYATSGPACCDGPWVGAYNAGFEGGNDGFVTQTDSAPVAWHVTEDKAFAGTKSMTFSNPATGTYVNPAGGGAQGRLISKSIQVPPYKSGNPFAEFWLLLETEWDDNNPDEFFSAFVIDELRVSVAVDGATTAAVQPWISHYLTNTTRGNWVKTRVDLDAFRGENVQLIFEFESDSPKNNFAGPFIDNVTFRNTCKALASIQCVYGGDCTPGDDCQDANCSDDFVCVDTPKPTPECCEDFTVGEMTLNFESESTDWTFETCSPGGDHNDTSAVWQFADQVGAADIDPKQGEKALYFGNGADYGGASNLGSCGTALSSEVTLQADVPWSVSFWVYADIEKIDTATCDGGPGFSDVFTIEVIDTETGQATEIFDKSSLACNEFGTWVKRELSLSAWSGKTVAFQFSFDSFDAIENTGAGIAVDDIQFIQGCPEIP